MSDDGYKITFRHNVLLEAPPVARIELFKATPPGTTGRAFLRERRPVVNLMKRRSRRLP